MLAACAAALLALSAASASAATEPPVFGDQGGETYRDICPSGQYMAGVRSRSLLWIDQITAICATLAVDGSLTNPAPLTPRGRNGGGPPNDKICPQGSIISAMGAATLGSGRLSALKFVCRATSSSVNSFFVTGNPQYYGQFPDSPHLLGCSPEEAAIGLHGRDGDGLSVGIVCGPFSQPPAPSNEPTASAAGSAAPYNKKVLEFALNHLEQNIGEGESVDVVSGALAYAKAKPSQISSSLGNDSFGRPLALWSEAPQPGDIEKLAGVTLSDSFFFSNNHSAIIESVADGKTLHVIQQNAPLGDAVERGVIDFNWTTVRGSYQIYRPISLEWRD